MHPVIDPHRAIKRMTLALFIVGPPKRMAAKASRVVEIVITPEI
jgi:hypothetical protein